MIGCSRFAEIFNMEEFKDNKVTLFQSSVSGSIGGIGFMLVGHPFDTIKVCFNYLIINWFILSFQGFIKIT